jgi:hypothetical protein
MSVKSVSRAVIVLLAASMTACGDDSSAPTAPTPPPAPSPSTIQGSVSLAAFQFAVINLVVDRAGTLSSRVDWASSNNDIDTAVIRGRCSVTQILSEAPGCTEAATVAIDETTTRPSVLSPSVQPGDHTLIIFNFGPGTETASYSLQGFVSGGTSPAVSPPFAPPPTTPPPTPPPGNLCVPSLGSPPNNAVLDNGRRDANDAIIWDFDWSDCPQATEYHLYAIGPTASFPLINRTGLTQSSFRHVQCGSFVADQIRLNWSWRVRARTGGVWGDWSAFRTFNVEPVDSDPPQSCP